MQRVLNPVENPLLAVNLLPEKDRLFGCAQEGVEGGQCLNLSLGRKRVGLLLRHQSVDDAEVRQRFEKAWGVKLPVTKGLDNHLMVRTAPLTRVQCSLSC